VKQPLVVEHIQHRRLGNRHYAQRQPVPHPVDQAYAIAVRWNQDDMRPVPDDRIQNINEYLVIVAVEIHRDLPLAQCGPAKYGGLRSADHDAFGIGEAAHGLEYCRRDAPAFADQDKVDH
jgi:hypothetical protein